MVNTTAGGYSSQGTEGAGGSENAPGPHPPTNPKEKTAPQSNVVDGKIVDPTRIAVEPRGIFGLEVAAAANGRIGVAWQSQNEDDTGVSFAALSCPAVAAAARARP